MRDFKVTARNSAYAYKGRATDVRDVSPELGVRYVLLGRELAQGRRAGARDRPARGEALKFIEPGLLKRYLDGLRMAGLPEKNAT